MKTEKVRLNWRHLIVAFVEFKESVAFFFNKMSYKSNTNGIKVTMEQWKNASIMDTSVKFAGEEAKDRLYEPKHKKKLVRVLTVVAYVFFVSLAAIMLSLYYVFLWKGDQTITAIYVTSSPPKMQKYYVGNCNSILAGIGFNYNNLKLFINYLVPTYKNRLKILM